MSVLLMLYAGGLMLPLTLPLLALGHVLVFTLYNSQGYAHHGFQIVSLTLVAQAGTVFTRHREACACGLPMHGSTPGCFGRAR
jgi:hypothetical protein